MVRRGMAVVLFLSLISLTFAAPPNRAPTADAGPDQAVIDAEGNGEMVTLDGSGSSDRTGEIISYIWTEDGLEIAAYGVQDRGQHTEMG